MYPPIYQSIDHLLIYLHISLPEVRYDVVVCDGVLEDGDDVELARPARHVAEPGQRSRSFSHHAHVT